MPGVPQQEDPWDRAGGGEAAGNDRSGCVQAVLFGKEVLHNAQKIEPTGQGRRAPTTAGGRHGG